MTLTIVMLRTLFELEVAQCIGVVVLPEVSSKGQVDSSGQKESDMRNILDAVGLRFVPIFGAKDSVQAAENLQELYNGALPMGVTLCLTTSLTAACTFAETNPTAFSEKTARVILMGGARRREHAAQWLEPDPDAQNFRQDLDSASKFFSRAQELSVPLVVVSRFASRSGHMPRALFDVLSSHCGSLGEGVASNARGQLQQLWSKVLAPVGSAARGGLPGRCDKAWFLDTFCSGREPVKDDDDIWQAVTHFNVYS